jgi:type I restriction enzyme R subunit
MSEAVAHRYDPIAVSAESTVVSEYVPDESGGESYQSEAELESSLIKLLQSQAYEYLPLHTETDLIDNLRARLEALNGMTFTDGEWDRFFTHSIADRNDGIVEKTLRVQEDAVQVLRRDDGSTKNVMLINKTDIHNNRLQVINQYEVPGRSDGGSAKYSNRYDVTILVNGLPLVHVELKRRGVDLREAFNGFRPVRVRAAVRDRQRHADEILFEHDAPSAYR